jgi:hypothetical protein
MFRMTGPQLLRAGPDSPLHPVPLWARPGLAGGRCCDAALVREFRREARVVREGMEGDLIKVNSGVQCLRPMRRFGHWSLVVLICFGLQNVNTAELLSCAGIPSDLGYGRYGRTQACIQLV